MFSSVSILLVSFRISLLAPGECYDYPSANEEILMAMGECVTQLHLKYQQNFALISWDSWSYYQVSATYLKIANPQMKSAGAWSSNYLRWLHSRAGLNYCSPNNNHQDDMRYWSLSCVFLAAYTNVGAEDELPLGKEFQNHMACFVDQSKKTMKERYRLAQILLDMLQ